jgi:CBS domain containing-hemolysin-like protein
MVPKVFYVKTDQTLDDALAIFVRSRHHLLMVVDEAGLVVGLISLGDVLATFFGYKVKSEQADNDDTVLAP